MKAFSIIFLLVTFFVLILIDFTEARPTLEIKKGLQSEPETIQSTTATVPKLNSHETGQLSYEDDDDDEILGDRRIITGQQRKLKKKS